MQIYSICNGQLGSRGGGSAISERRHQTSDKKKNHFARWVVFIVHQLYKYIYSIVTGRLFYPSLTVYLPYMLLNNIHS